MRWLENLLLVVGLTTLGLTFGGLGLAAFAVVVVFRGRAGQQPSMNWGSLYGAIGALICGGFLGALVGFAWGINCIRERDDRPWPLTAWLGIAAGLILGLTVRFVAPPYLPEWAAGLLQFWPTAIPFVISMATLAACAMAAALSGHLC
jgi:hypothetical protein